MSESVTERFQRLEPLLDRALELEGDARASFLRTCAEIHPDLIDDLRRGLAETGDTLPTLGKVAADVTRAPATDRRGLRAGPWRLTGKIGRGGMGTVYVAQRDDGAFDKRVAVKLLRHADGRFKEHLQRERQLLARLDHPGIARLLDGGLMRDGQPYLVMELAEGDNLDVWCTQRQPDLARRLAVFLDVCAALSYAHSHLVVHRDLKPSNIRVDAHDRVKLLDFGIAKLLDAPTQGESRNIAVTPDFAAPEQLAGGDITTRTDVYALGALLYQMLTGHSPHPPFAGNWEAQFEAVCRSAPAPPSQAARAPGSPIPAARLRGDLDAIVLRALARDPDLRYASVDALAEDLRRYLDGRSVRARAAGIALRLARWYRRNWLAASLAGVVVLSLVAASLGLLWQSQQASSERDIAQRATQRSDALRNHLLMLLRDGDQPVRTEDEPPDGDALAQALAAIEPYVTRAALDAGASNAAPASATLQQRVAAELAHGEPDLALQHLRHALALRRALSGESAALGALLGSQARLLMVLDRLDEAEASLLEALRLQRQFSGTDGVDTLDLRLAWAELLLARGDAAAAATELVAVRNAFETRFGIEHPHSARAQIALARVLAAQDKGAEAAALFNTALQNLRTAAAGDRDALTAALCHGAELALAGARWVQAETLAQECLASLTERVAASHPQALAAQAALAAARYRQHGAADDANQHRRAVEALAARLGGDNRRVVQARAWL